MTEKKEKGSIQLPKGLGSVLILLLMLAASGCASNGQQGEPLTGKKAVHPLKAVIITKNLNGKKIPYYHFYRNQAPTVLYSSRIAPEYYGREFFSKLFLRADFSDELNSKEHDVVIVLEPDIEKSSSLQKKKEPTNESSTNVVMTVKIYADNNLIFDREISSFGHASGFQCGPKSFARSVENYFEKLGIELTQSGVLEKIVHAKAEGRPIDAPKDAESRLVRRSIPANWLWTDTKVGLQENVMYSISAKGQWIGCGHGRPSDANGCGQEPCSRWNSSVSMPTSECMSLIGKVGSSGSPFFVGTESAFKPSASGRLFLGPNDSSGGLGDNRGLLNIEIETYDTTPKLGPGSWPAGLWRNELGNEIRLKADGTASYKLAGSEGVNDHLTWTRHGQNEMGLRIDRWETSKTEGLSRAEGVKNAPSKVKLEIGEYLARIGNHEWWTVDSLASPDPAEISLTYHYNDFYFRWSSNKLTKVESRGAKSKQTTYKLVELDSAIQERKRLENERAMAQLERDLAKVERRTAPAVLELDVKFKDDASLLPNAILDAGEIAYLIIKITNHGKGNAIGVEAKIIDDRKMVTAAQHLSLGDVGPDETREGKIEIGASNQVLNGKLSVKVVCSERRGYSSEKVLEIPTAALRKPKLVFEGSGVQDGTAGGASGNDNGVPESGEVFVLNVKVRNNGSGDALNAQVFASTNTSGVTVKEGRLSSIRIHPGETVLFSTLVAVARNYSRDSIAVDFKANDARGFIAGEGTIHLKARSISPTLALSCKLFDRRGKLINSSGAAKIENGEEGRLEVTINNKGMAEAKDVRVAVVSDTIGLPRNEEKIGSIPPGKTASPVIFSFLVPRTLGTDPASIKVQVDQKDFLELVETVVVPHRPFTP